jgi:mucin-19
MTRRWRRLRLRKFRQRRVIERTYKEFVMTRISLLTGQGFAALLIAGLSCTANCQTTNDVVAIGPLELVEATSITVLGQSYRVDDTAGLATGDKVAIHGSLQPDGSVTSAWAESLGAYTAGSDAVFETGIVTGVNETFGRLSIGDSKIDYTAALSEPGSTSPSVGAMVAVTGIQPESGGVILGTTTNAGATEVQVAMAATGARAGIAIAGITGTSVRAAGITGTSVGTAGITGTSIRAAGITGTSVGTAGITGTSIRAAGITGTSVGTAGITGTSIRAAGITGTSLGTAGITGTSVGTAGITGTSVGTAGITGTSVGTAGITGTSVGTAGITGTSVGTAGITGTSVGTAGITGTSLGTAGITGTSKITR